MCLLPWCWLPIYLSVYAVVSIDLSANVFTQIDRVNASYIACGLLLVAQVCYILAPNVA